MYKSVQKAMGTFCALYFLKVVHVEILFHSPGVAWGWEPGTKREKSSSIRRGPSADGNLVLPYYVTHSE